MGDLQTPFNKPAYPNTTDLSGDLATARGTDPNVSADGEGALNPLWPNPVLSSMGQEETANSVSGLPLQPSRFQPTEEPPAPPSFQDRNPGTIDQK